MTLRDRFIKSVIATAQANDTQMPWTRGAARRKSITRRHAPDAAEPRAQHASG